MSSSEGKEPEAKDDGGAKGTSGDDIFDKVSGFVMSSGFERDFEGNETTIVDGATCVAALAPPLLFHFTPSFLGSRLRSKAPRNLSCGMRNENWVSDAIEQPRRPPAARGSWAVTFTALVLGCDLGQGRALPGVPPDLPRVSRHL